MHRSGIGSEIQITFPQNSRIAANPQLASRISTRFP
jgi:hypothetical protein